MATAEVPAASLLVEVVYSPAARQVERRCVALLPSATVRQVLRASGLLQQYPELAREDLPLGCWGRRVHWDDVVEPGSRIEVYRSLTVDPKEARRQRYRAQGKRPRIQRRPQEHRR